MIGCINIWEMFIEYVLKCARTLALSHLILFYTRPVFKSVDCTDQLYVDYSNILLVIIKLIKLCWDCLTNKRVNLKQQIMNWAMLVQNCPHAASWQTKKTWNLSTVSLLLLCHEVKSMITHVFMGFQILCLIAKLRIRIF